MNTKFYRISKGKIKIIAAKEEDAVKLSEAFDLIKNTDRVEYDYLQKRLKSVIVSSRLGSTNEFFMPERIWLANRSVIVKNDVSWLASLLIHEAFHATQFKNGKYVKSLSKLEPLALRVQKKFLQKLGESGNDVDRVQKNKYWKEMTGDKASSIYFRQLFKLYTDK